MHQGHANYHSLLSVSEILHNTVIDYFTLFLTPYVAHLAVHLCSFPIITSAEEVIFSPVSVCWFAKA